MAPHVIEALEILVNTDILIFFVLRYHHLVTKTFWQTCIRPSNGTLRLGMPFDSINLHDNIISLKLAQTLKHHNSYFEFELRKLCINSKLFSLVFI